MKPGPTLMKHFLQIKDLRAEEYAYLFERTRIVKTRFKNYERYQPLVDRTLAMIFEKASTRTRVSFEACLLYTSPSPRDRTRSRMPSSA